MVETDTETENRIWTIFETETTQDRPLDVETEAETEILDDHSYLGTQIYIGPSALFWWLIHIMINNLLQLVDCMVLGALIEDILNFALFVVALD